MFLISGIGDQKSDSPTISANADGTNDGGRLSRAASSCSIACAILSITLRLEVGFIRPGMPTRSPPATRSSASANVTIRPRSTLLCRPPFLFTDIEMIVARRAAPVDALGRFAGVEAAVLPETFSGAGAPSSMQAVDDVGSDMARFKYKTRQRGGERSAFTVGTSDCCDFPAGVLVLRRHQP